MGRTPSLATRLNMSELGGAVWFEHVQRREGLHPHNHNPEHGQTHNQNR